MGGLPCCGWVRWHDSGRLESVKLAREATVQGHAFPIGSRVNFDAEGRLRSVWLSRKTLIGARLCRGGPKMETSFYPDGAVAAFFPPDDVEIDGVKCAGSRFHPVRLHRNGRLKSAKLAADCTIEAAVRVATLALDARGRPAK